MPTSVSRLPRNRRLDAHRPARRQDVIVSELGDEGLAYDFGSHGTHCMSPAAFALFRRCDGKATVAALEAALVPATLADRAELVRALEALAAARLIEPLPAHAVVDRSRRRLLGKLAVAAAVPLVWSIVAPSIAEAASSCVPPPACMGASTTTCCGLTGSAAMTCTATGCDGSAGLSCNFTCP